MTKGLMERSLHHELVLGRVREKAKMAEEELFELRNWKVVTEQKLKLAEQARDEFQKMTEELKKILEDKENDLRHAKETAVLEYRDSNTLLSELGVSYNDGFDDALCQAKALYPNLDFHPSISAFQSQLPFSPISQTIRTSFLERRCSSPSPLRSRRLREKKPVKLKTPSLLMPKMFYPFILYKYFENNYVLPVKYWVNLYLLHL